jgi:hypothetical protein
VVSQKLVFQYSVLIFYSVVGGYFSQEVFRLERWHAAMYLWHPLSHEILTGPSCWLHKPRCSRHCSNSGFVFAIAIARHRILIALMSSLDLLTALFQPTVPCLFTMERTQVYSGIGKHLGYDIYFCLCTVCHEIMWFPFFIPLRNYGECFFDVSG